MKRISEQELLDELRRLGGDSAPSITDMKSDGKFSRTPYESRFGSWNAAVRAAGYIPNSSPTEKELLEEMQRVGGDSAPETSDMKSDGQFWPSIYRRRFGSWNAALKTAGYTPNDHCTEDELLDEMRRLSGDKQPTMSEMNSNGKFSVGPYKDRFGSWNAAVRAAGYSPNREQNVSDRQLLTALREASDGDDVAPPQESASKTGFGASTYQYRFGSWWRAVVQAGLLPRNRRPLSSSEFKKLHTTATELQNSAWKLAVLLAMFTGLTGQLFNDLESEWVEERRHDVIVTVPAEQTVSGKRWEFRLPESWSSGGRKIDTQLPGHTLWFQSNRSLSGRSSMLYQSAIMKTAEKAELTEREQTIPGHPNFNQPVPLVRASDLRATGGIRMARNSVPVHRIRRHLGIKHTNWHASIEDFFLWLYVHEDITHNQYDPPNVVLDPV
ncbi:hypothetical protein GS429_05925 [Natronorubrum sp. JWXQ-INN-674]|uniref:Uncharacterized protein n=1 Tax=Natronorubrum halalkaliphilum TaxID=2691917 RepID=A0A6B0VJ84_9EURY|nr:MULTISPECIES: hypothetical protein [Natrialbaceae]MXV61610.1 hypothetical protein [Natronorubrum halalkaliphilum]